MAANLEATQGLVFSQGVLLALVDQGLSRDEAYRLVQGHAMQAWDSDRNLRDLLAADSSVELDEARLDECFSLNRVATSAQVVFDRLSDLKL
jgi:adenylosuccinate lyase